MPSKMLAAGLQGMSFGNGGSAADAQHIAVELVSASFGGDFRWPALALTIDSSALTAGIVDIPMVVPSPVRPDSRMAHYIGHILGEIEETLMFAEASTSYPPGEIGIPEKW